METLDPNSDFDLNSPNKRLKTESLALNPPVPSPIDKGKAPIIAEHNDESEDDYESPEISSPQNCGICFLEEGKTVRGLIDSCGHYFCFLCIIEWSKIESRCPLCRGRFSTIRRVRNDGSFIGEGSVRVPVRDQFYDPFGEPVDRYAQAKCGVCNGANDESLLLLCDLCDSPSHTYCVGLGATVPEGNWYCRDCALLQAEQDDNEMGYHGVASTVLDSDDEQLSTSASVSIFDIVRDPCQKVPDSGTNRLLKLVSQDPTKFSASAIISDQRNNASSGLHGANANLKPSAAVSDEPTARTLQNCRNVQRHINALRENWDAVRSGSVSFSFALSDSFHHGTQQKNVVGTSSKKSCKLPTSSCDTSHSKEPYNVDRAWKLMNLAKTPTNKSKSLSKIAQNKAPQNKAPTVTRDKFGRKCELSGRKDLMYPRLEKKHYDKVSEQPVRSLGIHQSTSIVSHAPITSGSKHQKFCDPKFSERPRDIQTIMKAKLTDNRECLASSEKLHGRLSSVDGSALSASMCRPITGGDDVSCSRLKKRKISSVNQVRNFEISAPNKGELRALAQADICCYEAGLPSPANLGGRPSNLSDFPCSTSSYEPITSSLAKLEGRKRTSCPGEVSNKINSKVMKDDEAKAEILSLVKLNLKLLSKNKQIGVDAFKEIARRSTHTILASCGFEHRKIVRSLPTLVCNHANQTQQRGRSTIVPSSCRECFYAFVKDVVNSILSEKLKDVG
ncbi:unnamed protein product [Amaranthus hypochondriacus]